MSKNLLALLVLGFMAILSACSTPAVTDPVKKGSLQINLTVPGGGNGNVSISGPSGFSKTVTATTTLSDLEPGAYSLKANDVQGAGTSANFTLGGTVSGTSTVVADSTATATVTYAPITGAITITVNGLPAGANANIAVVGASSGFNTTVTTTTTLTGLKPDNYFVTALNARASGAIVDTVFVSNDGNELAVDKGQLKSTVVNYTQRSGTGTLYVPFAGNISGFSATQLGGAGGAVTPASSVSNAGFNEAAVFDSNGNMYVSNFNDNSIKIFEPSNSASGFTEVRTIKGSNTGFNGPSGMAFDASGKLWVINTNQSANPNLNQLLVAFTPAQLGQGGNLTPNITITSTSFNNPFGLAFDASGNLWVTNRNPIATTAVPLLRFVPSQLTSSGARSPSGSVASSQPFSGAFGLAFDAQGNLWATSTVDTVVKFAQASLNGLQNDQALAPTVTLTAASSRGLAFDNSGNLWTTGALSIKRIAAADLATSGAPTAATTITVTGSLDLSGMAFNPAPSNLPIQNK